LADDLKQELIDYGLSIGLDGIGIAGVDAVTNPPQQKDFDPSDLVSDVKAVIALMKAFPEGVLELDEEDTYTFLTGFGPAYLTLERELNYIGNKIVQLLISKGYDAKLIEVNYPFNRKEQVGGAQLHQPYHKAVATQAGLGEEGIENLFLTPEFGPRVLLASIATNAPLEVDGPKLVNKVAIEGDRAGLEACPTSAISEDNYPPYNFNRNRCLWGIMGGVKSAGVDEPPYDWTNAEDAMDKIDEYRSKYVKFDELLEWDKAIGWFPKCVACSNMCTVGKEEE